MLIGYVGHPRVVSHYNDIVARTYSKLGISVEFIEVGGERGLRLLDEGVTDADTVRYELVAGEFSNFYILHPVIAKGATILLCIVIAYVKAVCFQTLISPLPPLPDLT
ncbi:hypothetical protein R1T43_06700 [Alteromonas sp. CI.11.F.A3]|uniref:hypothetical protein n=1 Tax=Alteromonas sp. CI.11.F.A3 TaxID=3079555 RepID=UPI0029422FE9|nr:hypothetical protein [Alteromonas sp. CI.11.F.A3]WOI38714.1 hypothetical protein R1T43_06700 [Alteromonas sp. CI.11.F.A3]